MFPINQSKSDAGWKKLAANSTRPGQTDPIQELHQLQLDQTEGVGVVDVELSAEGGRLVETVGG